jgi:hypothetical protein
MKTLFAFAICSFFLVLSASYSYPQPQAKSENNPTAQDKRGTQESPLIIQGDITTKAPEKAESDRKHEEEKIEIERSLAKYAGWTAAITGVLVLVTGVLAFVTYKLWKSTRDLATDASKTADRQAKEMQDSLRIAQESADTAKKSVELARGEFLSTHCPRLIVRRISIHIDIGSYAPLGVDYEITNIGGTPGTVTGITAKLWLPDSTPHCPPVPPYADKIHHDMVLESGASKLMKHHGSQEELREYCRILGFAEEAPRLPMISVNSDMYFFGYVVYEDGLKRRFETAFLRIYNFHTKRFSPVNDPDYEYLA